MIVVDSSALIQMLLFDGRLGQRARTSLSNDDWWVAPEHMMLEAFAAVRVLELSGKISEATASSAIRTLGKLSIQAVPTDQILLDMWSLRNDIAPSDASYVAIASRTSGGLLVTADGDLAKAALGFCAVDLVS